MSQNRNLSEFPSKSVEKKAKTATKSSIDSLATLLDLSKKEKKVHKFELTSCTTYPQVEKEVKSLTPVGEFPTVKGCPGFYYYVFKSSRKTSHYRINFFYDKSGEIVAKEISFTLIVH